VATIAASLGLAAARSAGDAAEFTARNFQDNLSAGFEPSVEGIWTVPHKPLRNAAAGLLAIVAASTFPAGAQQFPPAQPFPPTDARPPSPDAARPPPPAEPRAAPPAARSAAGPAVAGTWSGSVTQVGSTAKYSVVLTLTAAGGETNYPEVNCSGKLTRIGASRSYVFYVEVITQGHRDKGGRCPDGTITVGRAGDKLAWVWFGSADDELIVAYGTLTRKPAR